MISDSSNVRFYYIRRKDYGVSELPENPGRHPIGCVCVIRDEKTGTYSRGISMCSAREKSFDRSRARGIAYSRATGDCDKFIFETVNTVGVFDAIQEGGYDLSTGDYPHRFVNASQHGFSELTKFEEKIFDDK